MTRSLPDTTPPVTPDLAPRGASHFEDALHGIPSLLLRHGCEPIPLDVGRWHADAAGEDHWLLDRCHGPTVDLGCGPGRLVAALAERGIPALGVDVSIGAVRNCAHRGAAALRRDAFARLPGEGRWHHVLLADGNLGIGGDPLALLGRAATLLRPGGTVLAEVEPSASGLWRGQARLQGRRAPGAAFPWAVVGIDVLPGLASAAGLIAAGIYLGTRCFAALRKPGAARVSSTRCPG